MFFIDVTKKIYTVNKYAADMCKDNHFSIVDVFEFDESLGYDTF